MPLDIGPKIFRHHRPRAVTMEIANIRAAVSKGSLNTGEIVFQPLESELGSRQTL